MEVDRVQAGIQIIIELFADDLKAESHRTRVASNARTEKEKEEREFSAKR
jgi:hypothetical protein